VRWLRYFQPTCTAPRAPAWAVASNLSTHLATTQGIKAAGVEDVDMAGIALSAVQVGWKYRNHIKDGLGLVSNGKKVSECFRELQDIPEQAQLLLMVVEATSEPLRLCVDLAKRFDTMPLVEHAVVLARHVMAECERLLARNAGDEHDVSDTKEGWTAWWSERVGTLSEKGNVQACLAKLSMCQQALQLALSAVAATAPQRAPAGLPFRFILPASNAAKHVVEQFEMGRVRQHSEDNPACTCKHDGGDDQNQYVANADCPVRDGWLLAVGCVFEFSPSPVKGRASPGEWKALGEQQVRLQHRAGQFSLCFHDVDAGTRRPDAGHESADDKITPLQTVRTGNFARASAAELLQDSCPAADAGALAYQLGDRVLLFESVPSSSSPCDITGVRISAEVFEAIVLMASACSKASSKGKEEACHLHSVVDLSSKEGVVAWRRHMEEHLGAFASSEEPPAAAASPSSSSADVLHTPLRNLSLSR